MNVDQIRAKIAKIRFDLAALECPSITSDDVADVSDAYQDRLEYNDRYMVSAPIPKLKLKH